MLAEEVVPNGWTTEGYCKAGGFTSRSYIIHRFFIRILFIRITTLKIVKKLRISQESWQGSNI